MNAIVISIDPVIFRLGSFEIRWYVVAIISAIVVALSGVLRRKALHILSTIVVAFGALVSMALIRYTIQVGEGNIARIIL